MDPWGWEFSDRQEGQLPSEEVTCRPHISQEQRVGRETLGSVSSPHPELVRTQAGVQLSGWVRGEGRMFLENILISFEYSSGVLMEEESKLGK